MRNVEHGRFERALSGLTAAAAAVTTAEIYFEHYRASFGDKWMWSPIVVTPPVIVAGIMGVRSDAGPRRRCRSPPPSTPPTACWGEYFHVRGVARRPGGWRMASYNVPMGPPIAAPGLMTLVGGMGLLAAVLRREKTDGRTGPASAGSSAEPAVGPPTPPSEWLPRQRRGVTPQMVGRYPDFDVFDARAHGTPLRRA